MTRSAHARPISQDTLVGQSTILTLRRAKLDTVIGGAPRIPLFMTHFVHMDPSLALPGKLSLSRLAGERAKKKRQTRSTRVGVGGHADSRRSFLAHPAEPTSSATDNSRRS